MVPDPVASGEPQEQITIEAAGGAEVDILDLGVMAEPGGTGSRSKRFWRRVVASRSRSRASHSPCSRLLVD